MWKKLGCHRSQRGRPYNQNATHADLLPYDILNNQCHQHLMVVDTANEDAEDTETLILEECGPTECSVDVVADSLPKSNWFILPLVLRIEVGGVDDLNFTTPVTIACDADGGGSSWSQFHIAIWEIHTSQFWNHNHCNCTECSNMAFLDYPKRGQGERDLYRYRWRLWRYRYL